VTARLLVQALPGDSRLAQGLRLNHINAAVDEIGGGMSRLFMKTDDAVAVHLGRLRDALVCGRGSTRSASE